MTKIEEEKKAGTRIRVRLHEGPLHGAIIWVLSCHDQVILDCHVTPIHPYPGIEPDTKYRIRAYYREDNGYAGGEQIDPDGARRFTFGQLVT